jgi:hypothetical protein
LRNDWWIPAWLPATIAVRAEALIDQGFGGGKMETFKLGKRMTPAELLLAYKAALETIAKGSADAANIAQEALKL